MSELKAVLLDLDGTLYFKGEMIEGAQNALLELRRQGLSLRFLTNTDSKTTRYIHEFVTEIGLDVGLEEIFTPAAALEQLLRENPGKRCHFLLSTELTSEMANYATDGKPDYVVVGDFRDSVSYAVLNVAFRHVMEGAELIALQNGRFFISSDGYNVDTGAFVNLLEYASGKTARVLGKPSSDFFNMALRHVGCRADEVTVVGDDVHTDIAGAKQIGAMAVLVRTGKYCGDSVTAIQPDLELESVAQLPHALSTYPG